MAHLHNTQARYGTITKSFHWATALLIATILPLGIIAENMAYAIKATAGAPDQDLIARTAFLFSLHKTLGVTVFFVALLRIVWAISQAKPGLLNGDKKAEAFAAQTVHWLLYGSLIMVPLSGWVHHASTTGFAPIWWPFGQSLPFVPKDAHWADVSGMVHYLMQWILIGALVLHILGALKHHVIDKDATLRRMWFGNTNAEGTAHQSGHIIPLFAALSVWVAVIGGAALNGMLSAAPAAPPMAVTLSAEGGNWQVADGTLGIAVQQMGSQIEGNFGDWSASIQYAEVADETGKHGEVLVEISTGSLTLGSVTSQAVGPGYLESGVHPIATFKADILSVEGGLVTKGDLSIRGQSIPAEMPFDLTITDDTANAAGALQVDRRDFGIGQDVTDEGSLGFGVNITFDLTATRIAP